MADSDCIIVHEQVVVPDAVVVEEMVALPGEKGDKGDPFTYDDFTPEQIAELQRPATEAAAVANQAAEKANKAATDIKALGVTLMAEEAKRESAERGRTSAESERAEAEVLRETSFPKCKLRSKGLLRIPAQPHRTPTQRQEMRRMPQRKRTTRQFSLMRQPIKQTKRRRVSHTKRMVFIFPMLFLKPQI